MDTLFELGVNLSKGLRDEDKDIARVLARRDDPETSKKAAEKMVKSGALSLQEKQVYSAIMDVLRFARRDHFTAKELTQSFTAFESYSHAYHKIQRRLSGLRNKGKIELIQTGEKVINPDQVPSLRIVKPIYKRRDGCRVWRLK